MYTMEQEKVDGVLHIRVKGDIGDGDEAAEKAQAVIDTAIEHGINRVLLDERELNLKIDVLEIVRIATKLEGRDIIGHGGRLACLHRPECREIYKIYETVYKNRSFSYQRFEEMGFALAWLAR